MSVAGATVYTFASVSFTRVVDGTDLVPWFFPETNYTPDPVLGGTQVYVDIGSDTISTLSIRASCANYTDRFTLVSARNTTGTLSNTRTRSASVTLVKASSIDADDYKKFLIDLTFVLRP